MDRRSELHEELKRILGSSNVYYQPPASLRMKYPCIVYGRTKNFVACADDMIYLNRRCYDIYAIDQNPDSEIPDRLLQLPLCRMDQVYTADNLYHYKFTIYY